MPVGICMLESTRPVATCTVSIELPEVDALLVASTVPASGPGPCSERLVHPPSIVLGAGSCNHIAGPVAFNNFATGGVGGGRVWQANPGATEHSLIGVPMVTSSCREPGSHEVPKTTWDWLVVGICAADIFLVARSMMAIVPGWP